MKTTSVIFLLFCLFGSSVGLANSCALFYTRKSLDQNKEYKKALSRLEELYPELIGKMNFFSKMDSFKLFKPQGWIFRGPAIGVLGTIRIGVLDINFYQDFNTSENHSYRSGSPKGINIRVELNREIENPAKQREILVGVYNAYEKSITDSGLGNRFFRDFYPHLESSHSQTDMSFTYVIKDNDQLAKAHSAFKNFLNLLETQL